MTDLTRREGLTFAQAEGAAALPSQLAPRQLSTELRAYLWAIFFHELDGNAICSRETDYEYVLDAAWRSVLAQVHLLHYHRLIDEYDHKLRPVLAQVKQLIISGNFIEVLDFIQAVLRTDHIPKGFSESVDQAFVKARSAYRVFNQRTIAPMTSDEEAQTAKAAFAIISRPELSGPQKHLTTAAEYLTAGLWADSIRESVHAVEAVARTLSPGSKLDEALKTLEMAGHIHPALKRGFSSIYGYTSDQQGIRHPLIDQPTADVDEADALYMFGACAAFVSYLVRKGTAGGLL